MAIAERTDPLRNFKFRVAINMPNIVGIANLGFAQMSGPSVQNELILYREGGMNTSPRKMVGQSDHAPLTFAKGVMPAEAQLWNWQKHMFFIQWGQGLLSNPRAYRCDIIVTVYEHPITRANGADPIGPGALRIQYFNCWPGAFALNDFNAGDNALLISQMTIHHEGFDLVYL